MKKHYYLGLNARRRHAWRHLFMIGKKADYTALEEALASRYGGTAVLYKNGRTGLAAVLKAYFNRGDGIIVNGFTCYAVVEAVKEAGLTPIYADIDRDTLNYNTAALDAAFKASSKIVSGVIVQNTLGIPVDISEVERFAAKHGLMIIEDLAHSVGVKYTDGREAGTVGAATILSFGKDKAVDTISGGAAIFRYPCKGRIKAPAVLPQKSDALRARFYPLFAGMVRGLTYIHLGGVLMRILLKLRFVERSADNALDMKRTMTKAQAKEALKELSHAQGVDREFYLVNDREKCLMELKKAGYHFAGYWYEKPISPERYYAAAHFPEEHCPEAVFVSEHIINLPTFYRPEELKEARRIIKKYMIRGKNG